jgi:glycosyltransferase involved in cell wall biosynthesis
MNTMPLISIITVCYNAEFELPTTIESIINQTYNNIEYIIIDGNSKDNSVNLIKKYAIKAKEKGVSFKWVSEPDDGIYSAMNKGISLATGSSLLLLNAGDSLGVNHIQLTVDQFDENLETLVVYSDYQQYFRELNFYQVRTSSLLLDTGMTVCHQSMFIGKEVYERFGLYSLNYKLASDYEFILRLKNSNNVDFIKSNCSNEVFFLMGGASYTNSILSKKEAMAINKKYYGFLSYPHFRFIYANLKGLVMQFLHNTMNKVMGPKLTNLIRLKRKS